MKTVRFTVEGMSCASCQASVQKCVSSLQGVGKAEVNLLTREMVVEFDDNTLDEQAICKAVGKAGYSAEVQTDESYAATLPDNGKIAKKMFSSRILPSLILLLPLLWIALEFPQFESLKNNAAAFATVQLLLVLPIMLLNHKYFIHGFNRLIRLSPNMDSLIAIGTGAGFIYSVSVLFRILFTTDDTALSDLRGSLYFDAVGMVLVLITIGKWLELRSEGKTSSAIAHLISMLPKTAVVERDGKEVEIPVSEVVVGDTVILYNGSSAAVDGVVLEGTATLDQSAITGESTPIDLKKDDRITSGSYCLNGYLKFRAEKVGRDTTMARIVELVKQASASKAPISRLADKICMYFVPAVITIALITLVCWLFVPGGTLSQAISHAITVLVVSCPCALGLATPVAVMVGTGRAAEMGILFKDAESLENLRKIKVAIFDKTGTLTTGEPKVRDVIPAGPLSPEQLLALAASVEHFSGHPYAKAICGEADRKRVRYEPADNFIDVPGMGVVATLRESGKIIGGGNLAFLEERTISNPEMEQEAKRLSSEGKTALFFFLDLEVAGIIALSDTSRNRAKDAVSELEKLNVKSVMLTGDNEQTAQAMANELGIRETIANVLPAGKAEVIRKYVESGDCTAMIGDGINDAPALARASIGIAIGAGTDVAQDAADVIILKDDMMEVANAVKLSKAVFRNILMNLFWAFLYNILCIPIAAGVLGWEMKPWMGALAMCLSSVCVVLNALRLRKVEVDPAVLQAIAEEKKHQAELKKQEKEILKRESEKKKMEKQLQQDEEERHVLEERLRKTREKYDRLNGQDKTEK